MPDELCANIVKRLDIYSTVCFFKTSKALHGNTFMEEVVEDKPLVEQVVCGNVHTVLLDKVGSVYACGGNIAWYIILCVLCPINGSCLFDLAKRLWSALHVT